jgi:hypothetical protein
MSTPFGAEKMRVTIGGECAILGAVMSIEQGRNVLCGTKSADGSPGMASRKFRLPNKNLITHHGEIDLRLTTLAPCARASQMW